MKKSFRIFFLVLFVCLVLSGCGKKVSLETGDIKSDKSITSVGRFDYKVIDISHYEEGFNCITAFSSDSGYSYLLSDKYFYLNPNDYYFLNFDCDGNVITSNSLSLPIRSEQNILVVDSNFDLGDLTDFSFSVAGGFINYTDFKFGDNGYLYGVCNVGVEYNGTEDYGKLIRDYAVVWDSTGKCVLISELDDYEYEYSETVSIYDYDQDNDYAFSNSGIYYVDDEKYISEYFNFLNSDIKSEGFETVVFYDNDHFSGIFTTDDGKSVLGCFNRNTAARDCKPILIASTDCPESLFDLAYKFNNDNSSFRIVISDYSERAESNDPEEAWSLLKDDINNGFRPDMIVNTTGFDALFIDQMKDNALFSDLTEILSKDPDLIDIEFSDISKNLYYHDDAICCIVPSFTYSTIVGNSQDFASYSGWGYSDFSSYSSGIIGKKMLFFYDTKASFVERVINYNGSEYVDYTSRTTAFNSDEYISFLKYASSLPSDLDEANKFFYSESNMGMYLLSDIECKNLGDMNYYSTLYCMGDYSDIGFPHGVSGDGRGVISADMSIMILSTNAYTNECWDFAKGFLYSGYQDSLRTGIPVTASGFKSWCETTYASATSAEEYVYYKDGVQYNVPDVTPEIIDFFKTRIGNCDRTRFADYRVKEIAIDYATQYFDGLITAEEAASKTDKDVCAYLATF